MRTTRLLRFTELLDRPVPSAVLKAAGMISVDVRRLLYSYAAHRYSGSGVIIDAGIFFGASTLAFGHGVADNPLKAEIAQKWQKPIKSYERAIYSANFKRTFAKHGIEGFVEGSSFEHILRKRIDPVADLVDLTIADITEVAYSGEPIEMMFLDVLKSPEINKHVLRQFFPRLIPGALVDQQDYFIEALPYVKVSQEYLAPYFEFAGEIRSDALFLVKKAIPAEAIEQSLSLPINAQLDLLECAKRRTSDPTRKMLVELSKVDAIVPHDKKHAGELFDAIYGSIGDALHWRVHHACDEMRVLLGRDTLRPTGGWRPQYRHRPLDRARSARRNLA